MLKGGGEEEEEERPLFLYKKKRFFSLCFISFSYYKLFFLNMSLAIIQNNNKYTDINLENDHGTLDAHRRQIIKRKVLAIGKMSRSYTVLKEHPQLVQQLKTLTNGKLPVGTLATGEQGIREGKRSI